MVKQSFLIPFLCHIIYEHAVSVEIYSISQQAAKMKCNVVWSVYGQETGPSAAGILRVWSDGSYTTSKLNLCWQRQNVSEVSSAGLKLSIREGCTRPGKNWKRKHSIRVRYEFCVWGITLIVVVITVPKLPVCYKWRLYMGTTGKVDGK